MFGPKGNPSAKNLLGVIAHLQKHEGINFALRTVTAAKDQFSRKHKAYGWLPANEVTPRSRDSLAAVSSLHRLASGEVSQLKPISVILLVRRQSLLNCLGDFIDRGMLAQLLNFCVPRDAMQSNLLRNLSIQREHRCDLLFCKKKNLEDEVITLVSTPAYSCLPHKNEACDNNSLEPNECAKKRKRKRIEMRNGANVQRVD